MLDDEFEAHRRDLFGVAYRMLGRAADAEDIVHEIWLRGSTVATSEIRDPRAFLTTIATRLCLDFLRSARVRRAAYFGPWLPEPVPAAMIAHEPSPEAAITARNLFRARTALLTTSNRGQTAAAR